jgi:hypothetical protein
MGTSSGNGSGSGMTGTGQPGPGTVNNPIGVNLIGVHGHRHVPVHVVRHRHGKRHG